MKKPGRPSKAEQDWPMLVEMAERWRAGNSGMSVNKISRIVAGIEPASDTSVSHDANEKVMDGINEAQRASHAKRLARRFAELDKTGEAMPISVFRVLVQENNVLGNLRIRDIERDIEDVHEDAIRRTAQRCNITEEEVRKAAAEGQKIWRRGPFSPQN